MPKCQSPRGYAGASPEIVFEVLSPYNTRREVTRKTGEYLSAGVNVVCVVDPDFSSVDVHFPDKPTLALQGDDPLVLADLPGFLLPVSRFFE
ncbi:MAG: Uma2 family endonuclease [Pirellulaceae bacterium]|nr:Uma2 family endonuclease [Pirellulaceae bacterium]